MQTIVSGGKNPTLIVVPPGVYHGWMALEDSRKRGYDKGFALSDHADWRELLQTIEETGASNVITCHGESSELEEYLAGRGLVVSSLPRA